MILAQVVRKVNWIDQLLYLGWIFVKHAYPIFSWEVSEITSPFTERGATVKVSTDVEAVNCLFSIVKQFFAAMTSNKT